MFSETSQAYAMLQAILRGGLHMAVHIPEFERLLSELSALDLDRLKIPAFIFEDAPQLRHPRLPLAKS